MDTKVGRSRKRKIWMERQNENDDRIDMDEEEDDEERKMEKFFDLIKCIRESRERVLNQNGWVAEKEKENKRKVWEPRFQLEDFAQDHAALAAVALKNKGKSGDKQETTQTHALDLSLSLQCPLQTGELIN